jgi:putative DNA primase/helicase
MSNTINTPTWTNHRLMVFDGQGDTQIHLGGKYETITLDELWAMAENPPKADKKKTMAIMASAYAESDGRNHAAQREHGQFSLLRCDIDKGHTSGQELLDALAAFAGDEPEVLVYSTSSHTPQTPRWRGVIALHEAVAHAKWKLLQRALHQHLVSNSIEFDGSMERAGQYMAAPNRTSENYTTMRCGAGEGMRCDTWELTQTAQDALGKVLEHDKQVDKAREEAKKRALERRSGSNGVVGSESFFEAVNRTYPVSVCFAQLGFETRDSENWHHPHQTSKSYSWRDFGDHWVCVSSMAAQECIGSVSANGFGYGDAFDLLTHFRFGGDKAAATKALAQEVTVVHPSTGEVLTWHKFTRQQWLKTKSSVTPGVPVDAAGEFRPFITIEDPDLESGGVMDTPKQLSDLELSVIDRDPTQDQYAMAVETAYAGRFLFAHLVGYWFEWNGRQWIKDPQSRVFDVVRKMCRTLNVDGKREPQKSAFYRGVLEILKHSPVFSVSGGNFDADNYLLNTPSGVVNLRTGQVGPHDSRMLLSRMTLVGPEPGEPKLFLKVLEEITAGDTSLIEFMRISCGAMLSGATEGHWMLFWFGSGRNGKSLLAEVLGEILGTYAWKLPATALMSKANESHPTSIAQLAGVRMALSSEVSDDAFWNASLIKELTGDDTLTARWMRCDEFSFKRTHKHLVLGNHRPQIRVVDPALMQRMKLVPFSVSFAGREDPELKRKLQAEYGQILSWLISGHAQWISNNRKLPLCEAVEASTKDYADAQSTTAKWLDERCLKVDDDGRGRHKWPKSTSMYNDYMTWKKERGEAPVSQTRWGDDMRKLGFSSVKADGVRYVGVILRGWVK